MKPFRDRALSNQPPPTEAPATVRRTPWPLAAVLLGALLVCVSFITLGLVSQIFVFWLFADEYVRTTLEVTDLVPGSGGGLSGRYSSTELVGIVAASGEEFRTDHIPDELYVLDSGMDATARLLQPEEARGKVVEVWFVPKQDWFLADIARLQYVSQYETLPSGMLVLGTAAICLTLFAIGTWLVVHGARRALAANLPMDAGAK